MKFYAASLCLLTLAFTTVLPAGEELFQQSIDLKSIAGGNGVEVKQEATGIKVSFPAVSKENRWPESQCIFPRTVQNLPVSKWTVRLSADSAVPLPSV